MDEIYKDVDDPINSRDSELKQDLTKYKKTLQKIIKPSDYFIEYFNALNTAVVEANLNDLRTVLTDLKQITKIYMCNKTSDFDAYSVPSHLMEIAFTYDSDFTPDDNIIALRTIKHFLEIPSCGYAPSFLDLDIIPQLVQFFFDEKSPKVLCLKIFKSIIYSSDDSETMYTSENEIEEEDSMSSFIVSDEYTSSLEE